MAPPLSSNGSYLDYIRVARKKEEEVRSEEEEGVTTKKRIKSYLVGVVKTKIRTSLGTSNITSTHAHPSTTIPPIKKTLTRAAGCRQRPLATLRSARGRRPRTGGWRRAAGSAHAAGFGTPSKE